jgi:hypothetical protein
MRRILPAILFCVCWFAASTISVQAAVLGVSKSTFYYKDSTGKTQSASVIYNYRKAPLAYPPANIDPRLDPKLCRAATIAEERANARSRARCWHYVKEALFASGVISAYPKSAYAYQAGEELVRDYGFKRLSVRDPYAAPVGAVLVYSHGSSGAGHVEIRTKDGFVSDYRSKTCSHYPLIAAYAK